jgi:hypothetical protein
MSSERLTAKSPRRQSSRLGHHLRRLLLRSADVLVPEERDLGQARDSLLEQLEQFAAHVRLIEEEAGEVTPWARETRDPPAGDRIGLIVESDDDHHRGTRLANGPRRVWVGRDDHIRPGRQEFAGQCRPSIEFPVRIADLDTYALAGDVASSP